MIFTFMFLCRMLFLKDRILNFTHRRNFGARINGKVYARKNKLDERTCFFDQKTMQAVY